MDFPKRNEIWLVSLEPVKGKEIGKTRPALVVSNNRNNEFSGTVTVLPITSKIEKLYPFEIFLSKEEINLSKDSKIKANQIRTVDKRRLVKYLAKINNSQMKASEKAILIHLGIDQ